MWVFVCFRHKKTLFPSHLFLFLFYLFPSVFGSQRDFNFPHCNASLPNPNELTILQMQLVCYRPFTSLPRLSPAGAQPGSCLPSSLHH